MHDKRTRNAAAAPSVPIRLTAAALLATTLGVLPVFFFGTLAVVIRADLGFSQSRIGFATAAFFAASAVLSAPGGWTAEHLGGVRTAVTGVVLATCALGGIAFFARSYSQLLALLALSGAANALVQPATNGLLAGRVAQARRGAVFGVKQAAVPLASTLSGVALPLLGLTLGWRGAFAVAALLGAPVLLLLTGVRRPQPVPGAAPAVLARGSRWPLVALSVVAAAAAGAGNGLGAFYVDSAVTAGTAPATAGVFLAIGSGTGIVARVLWGWWTDRLRVRRLSVVSGLLIVGAAGFALIGAQPPAPLLLVATVIAYAFGWGWNGLFIAAVVDAYPQAPSSATGVAQAGVFGGAVIVPAVFGLVAESASYPAAWLMAAALLCGAACLITVVGRRLPARQSAARSP